MNIALILAGGSGSRVGSDVPKQFIVVKGKRIIEYTIDAFLLNKSIDAIVIVCIEEWIPEMSQLIDNKYSTTKEVLLCKGGSTGLESVFNGVCFLKERFKENDLILIHDAARPFVDQYTIDNNLMIASRYGNAVSCVDLVETLVLSDESSCSSITMIPRDCLKRVMTPQTFCLGALCHLFSDREYVLKSKEPSVFAFYMSQGNQVFLSKGKESNIKITYAEDVDYFKAFFKE